MITSGFGFGGGAKVTTGGLIYLGTWNANTNSPTLTSGVGTCGGYYVVTTAGTTNLDGTTDWQIGDWAIFECNTNTWQKIDNHDIQAYTTIQDEGVGLPQQSVIDFQGAGVNTSNGSGKTIVTINGNLPTTNYGLYAQTSSSTPITGTTAELSLLDGGVGSLSVPANGFQVGDSFHAVITGHINSANNQTLRIRIKANAIILVDTGLIPIATATTQHFKLEVFFTIRQLGVAGVGSIVSGGSFQYTKNASTNFEGVNFSTENALTFDTTIINTLSITGQWGSNNASNSIYSEIFTLNKTY